MNGIVALTLNQQIFSLARAHLESKTASHHTVSSKSYLNLSLTLLMCVFLSHTHTSAVTQESVIEINLMETVCSVHLKCNHR